MSKPHHYWIKGLCLSAAYLLAACQPAQDERIYIDLSDAEDYAYWLEEERDEEAPEPFNAEPLVVTGKGVVKAVPDIAVITARITFTNKNESAAFQQVSKTVNAVQEVLKTRSAETGFTAVRSTPQYDSTCQYENRLAILRYNEIRNDYYFNRRLDQKGDTKTKRRDAKPRLKQRICRAQDIEVETNMVIRLSPPDEAGAILQAVSNAGATEVRLYGYDFKNYDALYQKAASDAVAQARKKANMIARITKAELDGLVGFNVGKPARTGRFGPQPAIVNQAGRESFGGGFVGNAPVYAEPVMAKSSNSRYGGAQTDEIVVTASKRKPDAERYQELVNTESQETFTSASTSNALNLSLLSGPQTITVSAILRYDYKTVIDGSLVPEKDE
jgi:uncharacterized protein YggE